MTNDSLTTDSPTDSPATDASVGATATDPRPALAAALASCSELVDTVTASELDRPTPCTQMEVRGLLGHLIMVARRLDCAARSVPVHEWPIEVTGLADDEWAPAFARAAAEARSTWTDDALLDQHMVLPWAAMPGRDVVAIYTNEVVVHTWDLATAIGREPHWSDLALQVADAAIHAQLPDADRSPMWAAAQAALPPGVAWQDPFANAVAVADDAPLIERIVAWNGRNPAA
jgi:uncharacterized protein (TIGR03086 family)